MATGLPSQKQVIELLDDEFARAGYEIEDVVVRDAAQPPKITVIADGDKPLDLDTITRLSRSASKLLDAVDTAAGRYVLEVSSPGVDRPLTSEKHFRRARGRKVEATLSDGTQLTGRLAGIADDHLRLVVRPASPARPAGAAGRADWTIRQIPLGEIVKAVVQVEFSPPHPRELELAGEGDEEAGT